MNTNEIKVLSSNFEYITKDGIQINGLSNINESTKNHYIVYKILNHVNGKHYIGQHSTDNPLDNYMGSGKLIVAAIEKYPISCFSKEILHDFNTFEEMNEKEKELVPLSACYPYDKLSYNLKEGGNAGILTIFSRKKMSNARKQYFENMSIKEHIEYAKRCSISFSGKNNGMYGKNPWANLSELRKEEIRKAVSKRTKGDKNPMFKYPFELVIQMAEEYNKNGYLGVRKKFNYTACHDKLLCLFARNKISVIRKLKHHAYTKQEIIEAINIINQNGFDEYIKFAKQKYAFIPAKNNFRKLLKRHKMESLLLRKI